MSCGHQKNFVGKICGVENLFVRKKNCLEKNIWSEKILVQKKFGLNFFWLENLLVNKHCLKKFGLKTSWSEKILVRKICGQKKFWSEKLFCFKKDFWLEKF